MERKTERKIIIAIVALSFFLALAYSLYFQIKPMVDAQGYDNIAWNLVRGNGYKESAELSYSDDIAIMRVGPGYEFFIAAIYFIFGRHYLAVWIINALLSALTALLVYLLSKEIFKEVGGTVGLIAAGFIGFSPDLITMNGMLMTETLGIFLLTLSIYLFFKHVNRDNGSACFVWLTALVFGCAVLVRTPTALLLLPFCYYFFTRKQWRHLFIFLVILTAVFIPWTVRNYRIYHSFIPTNLAFGYDLLAGNHPGATGELEPYAPNQELMGLGRIAGNKLALKAALGFIFFHPLEFLEITLDRISIYFSFARPTGFWFHLSGWSKALTLFSSAVYSILLFVFGGLGIYRSRMSIGDEGARARLLFWMLVMMPLAIVGIIVETRYRFLSYPFLAVFAGYGFTVLRRQDIFQKYFLLITSILLLNTSLDILRNLDRIIERVKDLL